MATFPTVKLPEKPNQHPRVYHTYSPEWEQWYFLMSDAHVDSSEHVDWLLDEHLAEASRLNAPIIDSGRPSPADHAQISSCPSLQYFPPFLDRRPNHGHPRLIQSSR